MHTQAQTPSRPAPQTIIYAGNSANMAIPTVVQTRPVVFRERGSNTYRLCPYYWAVLLAEVPYMILQALLCRHHLQLYRPVVQCPDLNPPAAFASLVLVECSPAAPPLGLRTDNGGVHVVLFLFGFVLLTMQVRGSLSV